MVLTTINMSDDANRIFNIIKAKYDLNNKTEAIEKGAELLSNILNETYKQTRKPKNG